MKTTEKLVFHCPHPQAKRRLAKLFGIPNWSHLCYASVKEEPCTVPGEEDGVTESGAGQIIVQSHLLER